MPRLREAGGPDAGNTRDLLGINAGDIAGSPFNEPARLVSPNRAA